MNRRIKRDLLFFALPAFIVFSAGMAASGWDFLRDFVADQASLDLLSVRSVIGLAFVGIGLGIELVAAFTLRRSYSSTLIIREDHQLVTHGIYRLTRHPVYLGVLMVSMGVPIWTTSWIGLLIMLGIIPLILGRIRSEERMLIDEYGDSYRAYKKATHKLIPFIY